MSQDNEEGKKNNSKKKDNTIITTEKSNVNLKINEDTVQVGVTFNKQKLKNELNNSMIIEGDKKEDKKLADINSVRAAAGLKKLNFMFCNICKKQNEHLTSYCTNAICSICFMNHPTFTCIRRYKCIYCNSLEHLSKACMTEKAMNARAKKTFKCFKCGKVGHLAKNCRSKFNYGYGYGYNYNRNKFKRNKNKK